MYIFFLLRFIYVVQSNFIVSNCLISVFQLIKFVLGISMGGVESTCKVEGVDAPGAATVGRLGNSVSSAISYSVDRSENIFITNF